MNDIYAARAGRQPLGRTGKPEEIAKLLAFMISEDNMFMTGEDVTIDGGILLRPP